ncbi:MAG: hypothetical protein JRF39_11110, partial [Deltaproteobacteria bacterium]|nr:hypothetical protein [Deltaproteobacteria bacterium]
MKRRNERSIARVVIATGISSVVTQLLIIREFLAQFQGNEFVIALILFNWLILGGIGTLLARWITRRFWVATVDRLGGLSLVLAGLSVVQILTVRGLRDILFIHGSSVGFYSTLAYIFLTIAPYCLVLGFVLPYSLYAIRTENPDYPGTRIYIIDKAVFLANLPLLAATYLLFTPSSRYHPAVLVGTGLTFAILVAGLLLEPSSLTPSEGKLVYYSESRYGRIEVHQDQEQFTLFVNGNPLYGNQNLSMAEEAIHYPLAQLARTRNILLISA